MENFIKKIRLIEIIQNDMKFLSLSELWETVEEKAEEMNLELSNSIIIWNTQTKSEPNVLEINFSDISSDELKEDILYKIQFHTKKATFKFAK